MVIIIVFTFMVFIIIIYVDMEASIRHPDFGLNVKQLILKHGYPFENHTVLTADGYILEIHRIPHGKNSINTKRNQTPVLLLHGIFCSSADWVNLGPERSFGFILADHGYDVWLANARGNTWSRKHVRLNPDRDKRQFWDFSVHEIGYYDLSAFIDYILVVTNHKKLFYVGHSQGTTTFFVLASMKPEYNHKVILSVALAPATDLAHAREVFGIVTSDYWKYIEESIRTNEMYEFLPHTPLYGLVAQMFCNDFSPLQSVCVEVFYRAFGRSENQFNKTLIPVIVSNTPAGSSLKQLYHYIQLHFSKSFQQFDYGEEMNLKKYGQSRPPKYNLSKVDTPHLLYHGSNDILSTKEDVDKIASELQNAVVNKQIPGFNHLDPLWGIDVVKEIFSEVLEFMKKSKK